MSLSTILLKTGTVPTATPSGPMYAPSTTAPKKAAVVRAMRFTNTGIGTSKLRAWFKKGGGAFGTGDGARRLLPYDQPVPAGYTFIDDAEITLEPGDGIYVQIDTGTVEFVFSGFERDAS